MKTEINELKELADEMKIEFKPEVLKIIAKKIGDGENKEAELRCLDFDFINQYMIDEGKKKINNDKEFFEILKQEFGGSMSEVCCYSGEADQEEYIEFEAIYMSIDCEDKNAKDEEELILINNDSEKEIIEQILEKKLEEHCGK